MIVVTLILIMENCLVESPLALTAVLKLRFNSIAQGALDENGKLPKNKQFPEGSIIVKEIFSGADIRQLAVMQKKQGDPNLAQGWVWVEYNPSGAVDYGVFIKRSGLHGLSF